MSDSGDGLLDGARVLVDAACAYGWDRPSAVDLERTRAALDAQPALQGDFFVACALLDAEHVESWLAADAALALTPDGPRGWPPLLYVAYSKARGDRARTARALLAHGADPNAVHPVGALGVAARARDQEPIGVGCFARDGAACCQRSLIAAHPELPTELTEDDKRLAAHVAQMGGARSMWAGTSERPSTRRATAAGTTRATMRACSRSCPDPIPG
ncbi:MAG: hypothetical protein GY711_21700 [bacterium]|nr:hypothetical protein [bacterium]